MCVCMCNKVGDSVKKKKKKTSTHPVLWDNTLMTNHPEGINTKPVSLCVSFMFVYYVTQFAVCSVSVCVLVLSTKMLTLLAK